MLEYKNNILPEHTHPFVRISYHYKYNNIYGNWKSQTTLRKLLKAGICHAGGFERCPEKCRQFKKDSLRKEMFIFEFNRPLAGYGLPPPPGGIL